MKFANIFFLSLSITSYAHASTFNYSCFGHGNGGEVVTVGVAIDGNNLVFKGVQATYDPTYKPRTRTDLVRYKLARSVGDDVSSSSILISKVMATGASSGFLVEEFPAGIYATQGYNCRLGN
jgi:hypothetical protein